MFWNIPHRLAPEQRGEAPGLPVRPPPQVQLGAQPPVRDEDLLPSLAEAINIGIYPDRCVRHIVQTNGKVPKLTDNVDFSVILNDS